MSAGGERPYTFATPSPVAGDFSRASTAASESSGRSPSGPPKAKKPPFRPAPDDTKPVLRDPISRSDPVETEQAVLLPPPFP